MDAFKQKLTNIRMGAKNLAKGTLANMKKGLDGSGYKEADDAARTRNEQMIRDNGMTWGADDVQKPGVIKKAAGSALNAGSSFFNRLMKSKGGVKN